MFGALVGEGEILKKNAIYTLTFDHGRIFEYRSDSWVFSNLREQLSQYADVKSVNRPFFSSRYVVILSPKSNVAFVDFRNMIMNAWEQMGYGNISLLAVETEAGSSYPGGLPELASEITKGASQSIMAGVKPVIPWVIVAGIAYLGIKTKIGRQ